MSSFDTLASSVEDSRPIEVYEFALGATTYRYTSAEDTITLGGNDYTPVAISRTELTKGSDDRNRTLTITLPADNAFASQYVNIVPSRKATVSVIELQRDEPGLATEVLGYKGTVQSVRYTQDGTSAEIACRSIEGAGNQNIPRYTFMSLCNHVLYGPGCGVNPASFDHIGVASNISVNDVDISGLNASGISAVGGYATPVGGNDFRLVLAQSGDTITILLPFATSVSGENIQVFAGCDHQLTGDCANTFDNVLEYGGFAFVPNKNIFATGLD